jgi:hypothetical protein
MRKAIKYKFAFCAVGDAGEKETFDLILNLKDFIPRSFGGTLKSYCGPPIFYHSIVPCKNLVWPPVGAI